MNPLFTLNQLDCFTVAIMVQTSRDLHWYVCAREKKASHV